MSILGVDTLVYRVPDLPEAARFFDDFGLRRADGQASHATFRLPDGSQLQLCLAGDPALPTGSRVEGFGVQEVVWGVASAQELARLAARVRRRYEVEERDGEVRFLTAFGVPMALRVFEKRAVVSAPDALNAPGHVRRLNQHRRWRRRALPKMIAHVVFAVPDYEAAADDMIDLLEFRLSDTQRGFGKYLRASGSISHHNLLLLNANAPIPGMDGMLRFHHANFSVEDVDELMVGANYMHRKGWAPSILGLGRHRIDSALFYYLPCPAGGEAEYGADGDFVDDAWVPREWPEPLFGYAQFVHNLPDFLQDAPEWRFDYVLDAPDPAEAESADAGR